MTIEAMKQALEALELHGKQYPHMQKGYTVDAITTLRTAIEAAEKQEPVAHSVVAGALFDFMGWLTSRDKRLTLSSTDEAGPAVEAITEFAKMRGLRLENAQVEHWQAILTTPPAAQPALVQEPVTILPDGSAFGVMSFPLPSDHWLYAPNEYRDGEYEPIDLPKPVLTHALRDAVVAAVRYAVRGATMRGKEMDFDPDALVQNAVYALCGPYTTPPAAQRQWVGLTLDEVLEISEFLNLDLPEGWIKLSNAIEAKLKEKNT